MARVNAVSFKHRWIIRVVDVNFRQEMYDKYLHPLGYLRKEKENTGWWCKCNDRCFIAAWQPSKTKQAGKQRITSEEARFVHTNNS